MKDKKIAVHGNMYAMRVDNSSLPFDTVISIASENPEEDLLALVSSDSYCVATFHNPGLPVFSEYPGSVNYSLVSSKKIPSLDLVNAREWASRSMLPASTSESAWGRFKAGIRRSMNEISDLIPTNAEPVSGSISVSITEYGYKKIDFNLEPSCDPEDREKPVRNQASVFWGAKQPERPITIIFSRDGKLSGTWFENEYLTGLPECKVLAPHGSRGCGCLNLFLLLLVTVTVCLIFI